MKKKLFDKILENKDLSKRTITWKAVLSIADKRSLVYILNRTIEDDNLETMDAIARYRSILKINPIGLSIFLDFLLDKITLILSK